MVLNFSENRLTKKVEVPKIDLYIYKSIITSDMKENELVVEEEIEVLY